MKWHCQSSPHFSRTLYKEDRKEGGGKKGLSCLPTVLTILSKQQQIILAGAVSPRLLWGLLRGTLRTKLTMQCFSSDYVWSPVFAKLFWVPKLPVTASKSHSSEVWGPALRGSSKHPYPLSLQPKGQWLLPTVPLSRQPQCPLSALPALHCLCD